MFPSPVSNANDLAELAMTIMKDDWSASKPVRLLQLTAIHLNHPLEEEQLTLFDDSSASREKRELMGLAMDEIRGKFGTGAIGFGGVLNSDIGVSRFSEDNTDEEDGPL